MKRSVIKQKADQNQFDTYLVMIYDIKRILRKDPYVTGIATAINELEDAIRTDRLSGMDLNK